jgi:hypothetical protein
MSEERRTSRRTELKVPFRWLALEATDLRDQIRSWGLEDALERQRRDATLDADFEQAAAAVSDSAARAALRALKARLELVREVSMSDAPPRQVVELGADGVGFVTGINVDAQATLAVHLVLPSGYQVVAEARVTNVRKATGGFRVGARFIDLDGPTGRALTRLILR